MSITFEELTLQLKKCETFYLATHDGEQPRLRPMNMVVFDDRFFFLTFSKSDKYKELCLCPKIEICTEVEKWVRYCIRAEGVATIIEDQAIRTSVAAKASFFYNFWKDPDDPEYVLFEMKFKSIEHLASVKEKT